MKKPNPVRYLLKATRFFPEKKLLEWYPPFFMMGITVIKLSSDWRQIHFKLPLKFRARNMGGSMFGGFQASLADPIAAIACARIFPNYAIWTRKLEIDFVALGNTDLELHFNFDEKLEKKIRQDLETKGRSNPTFNMNFYRADGDICTKVSNTVAIRPRGYRSNSKRA